MSRFFILSIVFCSSFTSEDISEKYDLELITNTKRSTDMNNEVDLLTNLACAGTCLHFHELITRLYIRLVVSSMGKRQVLSLTPMFSRVLGLLFKKFQ